MTREKGTRKDWIALLKSRYEKHETELLDHKDCKEIADLLEEVVLTINNKQRDKNETGR